MPGQAIVSIVDRQWTVALATTPAELARGLGGISGIPAGTGMLFDTGWEQPIAVTTEPMLFPLDIIFIGGTDIVVGVERNAPPGSLVHSSPAARYFLEVNAGEAEGVSLGDPVASQMPVSAAPSALVAAQAFPWAALIAALPEILPPLLEAMEKSKEKRGADSGVKARALASLPMTRAGRRPPSRNEVRVEVWEERDRLHIGIQEKEAGRYLASWWDDEARQMFEDGFFKRGRDLEKSVLEYAEEMGILAHTALLSAQSRATIDNPVAALAEKWSRAKRNSALALKDLEALGPQYDVTECKEALLEYRDLERSDYGDAEEFQEARDDAWEAFIDCLESLSAEEEEGGWDKGDPRCLAKGLPRPAEKYVASHSNASGAAAERKADQQPERQFFSDSSSHCCLSVDRTGMRPELERAFRRAMARAGRS